MVTKLKYKKDQYLNKWEHIFKIWPVKTEDGFTVFMDGVWRMTTDDIMNPVRYHTNPLSELVDRLDDFLEKRLTNEAEAITGQINEMREQIIKRPILTEGKMRHGRNPMPPVERPKRPPPSPAPPPGRKIGGGYLTVEQVMKAWQLDGEDEKEKEVCPKCGTTDCYKGPVKFDISGAGVLHTNSKDIFKSCKTRQQLRALEKINIRRKKSTMGEPKELPKNQKLGKYKTGSMGPK